MKEALFWENINGRVKCTLCPRNCKIGKGKTGYCFIRKNINGKLFLLVYGKPSAIHLDPIEKKPLYHFYPGSDILSIGTAGCNLGCKHCQNCDLSKSRPEQIRSFNLSPEAVVDNVLKNKGMGISYTYNEEKATEIYH